METLLNSEKPLDKNSREYFMQKAIEIHSSFEKSFYYQNYINSIINWNFYNNNQWIFKEDNDSFLMDETQDTRNRVKFTVNIVEPLVKFLVGNTIRTDFSYTAVNLSPKAWARREERLNTARHLTRVSQMFPMFQKDMEREFNIGKDQIETQEKFNRYYVDEYKEAINVLIENVAEQEDFEELKNKIGLSIAVDGIGIVKDFVRNGRHHFKRIFLRNYIFDTSCIEPDHSDASYQGDWEMMRVTDMLEEFAEKTLPDDLAILKRNNNKSDFTGTINAEDVDRFMKFTPVGDKYPVFTFCWDEFETVEYGVVIDEYGYEVLSEIDGKKYTIEDCILDYQIPFHKSVMKGKLTIKRYPTKGKYAVFTIVLRDNKSNSDEQSPICLLDYGDIPYSETSIFRNGSHSMYNVYCLNYHNGIVHSPISSLISPNRWINRLVSMAESASNNWRPSGTIIDEDAISGGKDELIDIQSDINKGKVVTVKANGQLNNVIGSYGSNMGDTTGVLLNTAAVMADMMGKNKGINESMTGTVGGYRVSSTAVLSNIQMGSLQQEDFYYCLSKVLNQCYNKIATRGKLLYIDNETELTKLTGDGYAKLITLSKELANEDIRVYIKRSVSKEQRIKDGNDMLMLLKQSMLIDDETFASLFNVSSVDQVAKGLLEFQNKLAEAKQKAQAEAEAKALQLAEIAKAQEDAAYVDKDMDRQLDEDKNNKKVDAQLAQALIKNEKQQALK